MNLFRTLDRFDFAKKGEAHRSWPQCLINLANFEPYVLAQ